MNNETKKPLAVISGGTGYIGSAVAEELKHRGWQVAILSRKANDNANFPLYICDITDEQQVGKAIAAITAAQGTISACIHAAATPLDRKALLSTSLDSFTGSVDASLRGGFLLAKAVVPHVSHGASFIGITTEALDAQKPGAMGSYLVAKHALRGLLRVLAGELAGKSISVYAVAPGFLPGGLNGDLPPAVMEFLKKKDDKMQSPEDVAGLIADICEQPDTFSAGSSVNVASRQATPL